MNDADRPLSNSMSAKTKKLLEYATGAATSEGDDSVRRRLRERINEELGTLPERTPVAEHGPAVERAARDVL